MDVSEFYYYILIALFFIKIVIIFIYNRFIKKQKDQINL